MKLLLLITLYLFIGIALIAQPKQPLQDTASTNTSKASNLAGDPGYVDPESGGESIKFLSKREFWFGIATLIVLLVLTPIIINLVRKKNINDELAVKLIITTIVIVATLFLVVAGYDDKTIAPAFGLFGGILGYVFGRGAGNNNSTDSKKLTDSGSAADATHSNTA
jgi:hypothetical protein